MSKNIPRVTQQQPALVGKRLNHDHKLIRAGGNSDKDGEEMQEQSTKNNLGSS